MGVGYTTFKEYLNRFPSIRAALKRVKAPVDYEVENALYKRATGYTVKLKQPIKVKTTKRVTGKGEVTEERIEYADEEQYIPPDTTAQIFWLKNRRPDKWRDKRDEAPQQSNELLQSLIDLERGRT